MAKSQQHRAWIKWLVVQAASLLLLFMIASRWYSTEAYFPANLDIYIESGLLHASRAPSDLVLRSTDLVMQAHRTALSRRGLSWWPSNNDWFTSSTRIRAWSLTIPLWIIGLPLMIWSAWLIRRDLPATTGCRKCGYCLDGLPPGAPCPECGAKRESSL